MASVICVSSLGIKPMESAQLDFVLFGMKIDSSRPLKIEWHSKWWVEQFLPVSLKEWYNAKGQLFGWMSNVNINGSDKVYIIVIVNDVIISCQFMLWYVMVDAGRWFAIRVRIIAFHFEDGDKSVLVSRIEEKVEIKKAWCMSSILWMWIT
jgi:hypothetical protein